MSDYSNTFGGAAKDAANSTILGADHDTEYDAIATMSATKANKTGAPATTNNLAMLTATGDLADSLVETTGDGATITCNITGDAGGNAATADAWSTTRTIGMSGDVSSDAVNIDGSGNVTITNTDIGSAKVGSTELKTAFSNVTNGASAGAGNTTVTTTGYIMVRATGGIGITANIQILVNGGWGNVTLAGANSNACWSGISNGSNVRVTSSGGTSTYHVDKLN